MAVELTVYVRCYTCGELHPAYDSVLTCGELHPVYDSVLTCGEQHAGGAVYV